MSDWEAVRPPKFVAVLVIFVVAVAFLPGLFRPPPHDLVGKRAPEFPALAAMRGKTAVLGFCASWVDPCTTQFEILEEVAKRNPDVAVIGISTADDPKLLEAWLAKHPVHFPVVSDDDTMARAFEVDVLPTVMVVDRASVVRDVRLLGIVQDDLERNIGRAR